MRMHSSRRPFTPELDNGTDDPERAIDFTEFRDYLAERRAAGDTFEQAWDAKIATVPNDSALRFSSRAALEGTRDAWLAAWNGQPYRREVPVPPRPWAGSVASKGRRDRGGKRGDKAQFNSNGTGRATVRATGTTNGRDLASATSSKPRAVMLNARSFRSPCELSCSAGYSDSPAARNASP
jgi:hypothetical protein